MEGEVSFIIPIYNVEKYIRQCLDSILAQKDIDFEIIAVDDGSPDSCGTILDEYAESDSRIRVIHQVNSGVSAARNAGIKAAQGKWCYFVDSDDWLVDNSFSKLLEIAKKTDADIVFADCLEQYENGIENRVHLFSRKFATSDAAIISALQKSILCHKYSPYFSKGADSAYPAPWSKLIKTALIKDHNIQYEPYVCGVYDDGLFTLEILEYAKKIAYSGVCVYNYRIITSSIVHAYRKDMVSKFEKNCEKIDEFIQKYQKDDEFRNAEYCRRIAYLSSFMNSYFYSDQNNNTVKEKNKEVQEVIQRNIWSQAIKNADWRCLENKHRYCLTCMRLKCSAGLRLYSFLKSVKNRKVL